VTRVVIAVLVMTAAAHADPDKPWAAGVPQEQQDRANALYEEGNQLFAQQAHAPALEKYKQAIALWDHPLIRFNMAVTEIRLDRVLEAADDLDRALRYGDQPFTKELYQQALDYKRLVDGRVGSVEASCDATAAHLLLDGKPWFDCPGKHEQRVLAGEHAVVGEKQGYVTSSQRLVVTGGATASAKVVLVPFETAVVVTYPFARWIPWTTLAGGAALAAIGGGVWLLGRNGMNQFDADYEAQCANGCEPGLTAPEHRSLREEEDAAELKGKIGIGMVATGGAAAVAGVVLAIINRPTRALPDVEVAPRASGAVTSVSWRF